MADKTITIGLALELTVPTDEVAKFEVPGDGIRYLINRGHIGRVSLYLDPVVMFDTIDVDRESEPDPRTEIAVRSDELAESDDTLAVVDNDLRGVLYGLIDARSYLYNSLQILEHEDDEQKHGWRNQLAYEVSKLETVLAACEEIHRELGRS